MAAWRTSCPRLPVWEEANDRGLIMREEVNDNSMISVNSAGLALLDERKAEHEWLAGPPVGRELI